MKLLTKIKATILVAVTSMGLAVSAAVPLEVSDAATAWIADAALWGSAFMLLALAVTQAKIAIKWIKAFFGKST